MQWRIQDLPEEGAPTPWGHANIRFCQIFPKTAWNWKNLDPQGGARSSRPPLDPPLVCTRLIYLYWTIDQINKGTMHEVCITRSTAGAWFTPQSAFSCTHRRSIYPNTPRAVLLLQTKDFQWALWANQSPHSLGQPTQPIAKAVTM